MSPISTTCGAACRRGRSTDRHALADFRELHQADADGCRARSRTPLNSRITSLTCKAGPFGGRLRLDAGDARADEPVAGPAPWPACSLKLLSSLTPKKPRATRLLSTNCAGSAGDDVDRDREADALVAARGAGDGRVEADDFAAEIHERAAAVAGVDRGVGLNEVLPVELVVAQIEIVPALGADDAAGDALAQAERAADGQHEVADLERVAVAEPGGRQVARARSTARRRRSRCRSQIRSGGARGRRRGGFRSVPATNGE